jgi:hypothetical protein
MDALSYIESCNASPSFRILSKKNWARDQRIKVAVIEMRPVIEDLLRRIDEALATGGAE